MSDVALRDHIEIFIDRLAQSTPRALLGFTAEKSSAEVIGVIEGVTIPQAHEDLKEKLVWVTAVAWSIDSHGAWIKGHIKASRDGADNVIVNWHEGESTEPQLVLRPSAWVKSGKSLPRNPTGTVRVSFGEREGDQLRVTTLCVSNATRYALFRQLTVFEWIPNDIASTTMRIADIFAEDESEDEWITQTAR